MRLHRTLTYLVAAICAVAGCMPPAAAATGGRNTAENKPAAADSLTVSLVTCWPGAEIYELCGHEAIRIRGAHVDSVWNYGTFDFLQPNFVYRFVKGETDYMLAGYPFAWFMPEYIESGRRVVEQDLNLSQQEAWRLRRMLQTEALPANRTYRYNYVRDNCATRIVERIDSAAGRVRYPDSVRHGTFRRTMKAYHRDYPWYQFGIDVALGAGLDRRIDSRAEMFAPLEMMQNVRGARMADGRPLVRAERVLNEGVADATLGPTPWWLTPLFWSLATLAVTAVIVVYDGRRRRISRWWYSLYFGLCGAAGCIVAFLVFLSSHEATSPNILLLWLNPLQLLMACGVWWRRWRPVCLVMAWYDMAVPLCMLLSWPFHAQCGNVAFYPLMACAVALGAAYAIISPSASYKNSAAPRRKMSRRGNTPSRGGSRDRRR